jgi:iron complex outermembrane receptor protein
MSVNFAIAYAVRRSLALGVLAALGGGLAAHAQQASVASQGMRTQTTAHPTTGRSVRAKTATKARAVTVSPATDPVLLAQASPTPATTAVGDVASPRQLGTVVVTGSLIARPAAETAEAVTVINAATIKDQGLVNVEQAVDQITANVPSVNIALSVSTFTGGGSYANLRGLGRSRTLVLLDGNRLAYNVALGNAVDLSGIPFSAIDSVQVLREGASSLYGSDAIGGVINFITKKNFQGGEVDLDVDRPQERGGASGDAEFTFGHGDLVSDGYNFMITGSYGTQKELRADQRAFALGGYDPARGLSSQFLNGPFGPWPGSYQDANGDLWQVGYPACAGNPYLTTAPGYCSYVFSSATDLLPESSEASALVSVTKEVWDNSTLRLQYFYTRSKVVGWSGPQTFGFSMTPAADPTHYPTGRGVHLHYDGDAL